MDGEREDVVIQLADGKTSQGFVHVRRWSAAEVRLRSLKAFSKYFTAALLSVLVPIAHFFLVPALLLTAFGASWWTGREKSTVLGGTGRCPNCHTDFEIVRMRESWPLSDICNHCGRHVKIFREKDR
jgi:hypothetical protein